MHQIDQLSSVNQTEVQQDLEDLLGETRGNLDTLHKEVLTAVDGPQLLGMIQGQMKEGGDWKSYSSMKHMQTADTLAQMVLDYLGLGGNIRIDAIEGAISFAGYKELQQKYIATFGPTIEVNGVTKTMAVDGFKGPQFWKAASMLVENTIYGPTAADAMPQETPIVEQQVNASLDEGEQDVASMKADLEATGYLLKSSGKGFEEDGTSRESNRTSLVGLRQSTVTGMKSMMARLTIHNPGSKLIITGGTEGGIHSTNGEYSHGNGYKVDLSTTGGNGNAARDLISLTQVTQGGGRKYWKIPSGHPFGGQEQRIGVDRESSRTRNGKKQKDHLDIIFYPPGHDLPHDKKGNLIEEEGYAVQDNDVEKGGEGFSENSETIGMTCPFDEKFTVEQVKAGIAQEFSRTARNREVTVPLSVDDVYNACLMHSIPAHYFLAISRNDSHHATSGKGARTKNPGNYGNTDSGAERSFATYTEGCMALAKHLRKVIDLYNKTYGTSGIPELKHLVTGVGEDGEKFWGVWMSDVSGQERVGGIQRTLEGRMEALA